MNSSVSCCCNRIIEQTSLKRGTGLFGLLGLAHGHSSHPSCFGLATVQHAVVMTGHGEEDCSLHDCQEAKRGWERGQGPDTGLSHTFNDPTPFNSAPLPKFSTSSPEETQTNSQPKSIMHEALKDTQNLQHSSLSLRARCSEQRPLCQEGFGVRRMELFRLGWKWS